MGLVVQRGFCVLSVFGRKEEVMFAAKLKSREKFLSRKPVLLGVVGSYRFYEHPVHGDDYPLMVDDGENIYISYDYDLPTLEEIKDWD